MSFQHHIDSHKSGKFGNVADIGLPWEKCVNDEEVIQYVNYCFQVIAENKAIVDGLSLFKVSDCEKISDLNIEIYGAHGRIETCYKLLNDKLSKVMDNYIRNLRAKTIIYTSRKG